MISRHCLTALLTLAVWTTGLSAEEWSRFRGPNGAGQSDLKGVPTTWSADDYAWTADLPGIGHSSPVVWGKKIFLLSANAKTAQRHVLCVNSDNGEILWQRNFASEPHHLHVRNSFASCTPCVDESHVYFAWSTPEETTLMALDHDGHDVWAKDLGPWVSMHGFGTSPIIYGDLVILATLQQKVKLKDGAKPGESFVYAFNRKTGKQVWKTPRENSVTAYSVPCIYTNANGEDELINCASGKAVYSLDPKTGEPNWAVQAFSMRTVSSPVVAGGLVFGSTGSGGGGNYVVAVRPGEQAKIVYEVKTQAPYVPTPVAHGDLLFLWFDGGIVTCLDAKSGDVHWRKRVGGNYSGSPVRIGEAIYCINEDGVVVVLAAAREYEKLGEVALGEPSRATPTVANGQMLLRSESKLFALKAR